MYRQTNTVMINLKHKYNAGIHPARHTICCSGKVHPACTEKCEVAMSKEIRYEMKVSQSINDALGRIAAETSSSKGEILTKALNLLIFARDQHTNGRQIAAVENGQVVTEVVGM